MKQLSLQEEKALIEKMIGGNRQSFREFIEQYRNLVAHIVFRMIKNDFDREELCQEVFIKAYQNLASFQFQARLSTWLARIAFNQCVNFQRKERPQLLNEFMNPETIDDGADIFTGKSEQITPEIQIENSERDFLIQQKIEQLPGLFKTILTLYHKDEFNYSEIAVTMNMPEGTVKSYLFRARKLLKEQLLASYKLEELVS